MPQASSVPNASASGAHAAQAGVSCANAGCAAMRATRRASPLVRRGRGLTRRVSAAAAATLALGLAGCGGNVDQVDPFQAQRVVVLGDELSLVQDADGRRHGINQLAEDGSLQCASLPMWTQSVAARFGLGFAGCPSTGGG